MPLFPLKIVFPYRTNSVFFVFALAVFQSSFDSEVIVYEVFASNVIWNNFSLGFPLVIVFTGGYIINCEYTDDTLKAMATVPVSQGQLLTGKLIVTGLLTVLLAVFSFACTFLIAACVLHCEEMGLSEIGRSFVQICAVALFNYVAVAPLIVWSGRKKDRFFYRDGNRLFLWLSRHLCCGAKPDGSLSDHGGAGNHRLCGAGGSCVQPSHRLRSLGGNGVADGRPHSADSFL